MAQLEESHRVTETSTKPDGSPDHPTAANTDRRLPFILRVAAVWTDKDELPTAEDGQLRYWKQAPLTGNVVTTSGGRDVSFSDLEVR